MSGLDEVRKTIAVISSDGADETKRDLAFAILAVDENDPATLRWLAALCAKRAQDIS